MNHVNVTERIEMKEFPPFIRVAVKDSARKKLFSGAMKNVSTITKEYESPDKIYYLLYGEQKGKIVELLSQGLQPAKKLIKASGLSPSAVYHFLGDLKDKNIVKKEGHKYYLKEDAFDTLSLSDVVKLEEDSALRRKYGISVKELELAYFLWERFIKVAPEEGGYARTYNSRYTLADAVHRWRTGRTDMPVWALEKLNALSDISVYTHVERYHLPPGIPISPYYDQEYKLPVTVDTNLDKIVIQLLQKMSKNHLYTFPKRDEWLFETLHQRFGEFDDSTSRIPSAIIEVIKHHYNIKTLRRSAAHIPPRIKRRWEDMNRLTRIKEESSLLLHVVSLSSRSNGGFEITSRSKSFLQDVSRLSSDLNLGSLTVRKKHNRPHFRAYLSESKVDILRRYTHLFEIYPDLEIWTRIPLNQIAEKVVLTDGSKESIEKVCYQELSRFVESILKSLNRKKKGRSSYTYVTLDYTQYTEEITRYFWEQNQIPSAKRAEDLVETLINEEEPLVYA
ncbi:MAG: helix-turn-helix domain-containing protein [Candidatus Methanofastidiosia archaeon]